MNTFIKEISDINFNSKVLEHPGLVLVDFGAPWCPPCKALVPVLEELALQYLNIKIYSVNVDNSPELAIKYNIKSLPTVLIFKNGVLVEQVFGKQSQKKYQQSIEELSF